MMASAFEMSETLKVPVVLRVVTRLAHSRAAVEIKEPKAENALNPETDRTHWVLLPGNAKRQYASLVDKQPLMAEAAAESEYNRLELCEEEPENKTGVICMGIGYNYVKEAVGDSMNVLKVSQYPLPEQDIVALAALSENLLIVEDAAEAHGATYNGKKAGSFSDIGSFSFFANKNITTPASSPSPTATTAE